MSAPTGAGKSLTFELAPYTFDHLFGEDCNTIVFVIVPLISLMKDQVSNLNSRGIRASYVGDVCSQEQLEDILNLKEKIVFGSPRRSSVKILSSSRKSSKPTCVVASLQNSAAIELSVEGGSSRATNRALLLLFCSLVPRSESRACRFT